MSDETPNHIPAFLYYSSFTYFCFISWALAHLVILARTRKLRNSRKTPSSGSWFPSKNQEIEINQGRALVVSGCEAKIDSSQTFFATASCFALLFTTVVAVASVVEVGYEKAVARTITHESRYLYELMGEPFSGMAE